ncbi:MAG TPA: hypothetical protein VGK73_08665 [Polyangiaceae bacterium]
MATKRYLPTLPCLIDGVIQVELQEVNVTADPKKLPVYNKSGLAGFSQGAGELTIEFKYAVPAPGFEFNMFDAARSNRQYTIQVPIGAKTVVSEGEFTGANVSSGVNTATESGGTFMGTYNEMK